MKLNSFSKYTSGWFLGWLFLLTQPLHGQQQFTGKRITLARNYAATASINSAAKLVADGKSGAFVVFKSTRSNAENGNLYVQNIRPDGITSWPAEGLQVSFSVADQSNHQVVTDGRGGFVVVWEDLRDGKKRVYAQCINAEGKPLWPLAGISVSTTKLKQQRPQIAPDYQGGAYIFWEEEEQNFGDNDIVGQHINAQGEYVWEPAGLKVCRQLGMQQNICVASTPTQGVQVLWEDFRNQKSWKLYTQQFSFEGTPTYDAGGFGLLPEREITQRHPSIFGDGFGGLVCVYEALGGLNTDKDIYILRFNRFGKIIYQQAVCARSGDQSKPQVLKIGAEAYIVWEDHRNPSADIYLQKLDFFTGKPFFESGGIPIAFGLPQQINPTITLGALAGEIAISWEDQRNAATDGDTKSEFAIFAQKITFDGKLQWQAGGIKVASMSSGFTDYSLIGDERGGAWLSWIESSAGGTLPMYQHITNSGALQFKEPQPLLQQSTVRSSHIDQPTVVKGSYNDAYIAWSDYRNGEKNADIYLQRMDGQGNIRWAIGGIPICTAQGMQTSPTLLAIEGGVYLAWVDRRTPDDNLYIQRIDSSGKAMFNPGGIPICLAPRSQSNLHLAPIGNNRDVVAIWTDARAFYERGFDIYAQRIDTTGRMLWTPNGKPIVAEVGYQTSPSVAPDGKKGIWIAWMDDRLGRYNIRLQQLDAEGYFKFPTEGQVVSVSFFNQRTPVVINSFNGTAYVAWCEDRSVTALSSVKIKYLNKDGAALWNPEIRTVCTNTSGQTVPKLEVNGNSIITTWLDQRYLAYTQYNLFAQQLNNEGNWQWDYSGVGLATFLPENAHYATALLPNNILAVAWAQNKEKKRVVEWVKMNVNTGKAVERLQAPISEGKQVNPNLIKIGGKCFLIYVESFDDRGDTALQCLLMDEAKP